MLWWLMSAYASTLTFAVVVCLFYGHDAIRGLAVTILMVTMATSASRESVSAASRRCCYGRS